MTETIIPAFRSAPDEAILVGRLLSGYSELELEMWNTVHIVTGDLDQAVRELYGERGEKKRISNARRLAESEPNFSKHFNLILSVQSWLKKFSTLPVAQIISTSPRVSSHKRGGSRSSRTRGGMRWTRMVLLTRVLDADGEVVWS